MFEIEENNENDDVKQNNNESSPLINTDDSRKEPVEEAAQLVSATLSTTVEDKGHVVYIVVILYGIGFLLPWCCIISSLDYLQIEVSKN